MKEQCGACSNVLLRYPSKLHKLSKRYLRGHGLFSDSLYGWTFEIFQHFLSFYRSLVALNLRYIKLTLDRPWNVKAIQKQLSGLKNVLQKPHEAFQGFGSEFTELHVELDVHCSISLSTADKTIHEVEKTLVYKQCMFAARCQVADWCNRQWSLFSSSSTEADTTVTVRELSYTTSYKKK
jgi:hypothetical protein